jgi:hypothetical protein
MYNFKNGQEVMVLNNHHLLPFTPAKFIGMDEHLYVVWRSDGGYWGVAEDCIRPKGEQDVHN